MTGGGVRDVVLVSLEPWDDVWRRNQHLAAGLLRRFPRARLLVVEPPRDPVHDALRRTRPRTGLGLRAGPPLDGVAPSRLWLLQQTKWWPRRADPGGDRRRAAGVRRAAARVGLRQPVLWANDPGAADVLAVTGWPAVYDVTDDWASAHRAPAEHARIVAAEAALLAGAREVTVCSPALAARKGGDQTTGPVTLVTNGVDVDAYRRPRPRPADLPAGPCAVYVGTLHGDRLDVDLCVRTQAALAGTGNLVLVGPVALDRDEEARLRAAGVVLTGARPFDAVPGYLQHAVALVVPHVVDAFTDSLDPLKLYEYRAVGRPVVTTPVAGFRDQVSSDGGTGGGPSVTSVDATAFPSAVRELLTQPAPSAPADDVPTWEGQVTRFAAVLARAGAAEPAHGARHVATPR
ncbi:glycosyltransferase [Isoptericola sp. 4D.3]|uniref:Glycosyltransferase n=1 Tax=Isoptericola peretonis TaxID=2918523 RepID=A0ABT0J5P1_9MICO|nr:glycosyltransferase [Isoptericola sp. 4D.3]